MAKTEGISHEVASLIYHVVKHMPQSTDGIEFIQRQFKILLDEKIKEYKHSETVERLSKKMEIPV